MRPFTCDAASCRKKRPSCGGKGAGVRTAFMAVDAITRDRLPSCSSLSTAVYPSTACHERPSTKGPVSGCSLTRSEEEELAPPPPPEISKSDDCPHRLPPRSSCSRRARHVMRRVRHPLGRGVQRRPLHTHTTSATPASPEAQADRNSAPCRSGGRTLRQCALPRSHRQQHCNNGRQTNFQWIYRLFAPQHFTYDRPAGAYCRE
jgi:hypothetical protein